jgi:hypothetical protein
MAVGILEQVKNVGRGEVGMDREKEHLYLSMHLCLLVRALVIAYALTHSHRHTRNTQAHHRLYILLSFPVSSQSVPPLFWAYPEISAPAGTKSAGSMVLLV